MTNSRIPYFVFVPKHKAEQYGQAVNDLQSRVNHRFRGCSLVKVGTATGWWLDLLGIECSDVHDVFCIGIENEGADLIDLKLFCKTFAGDIHELCLFLTSRSRTEFVWADRPPSGFLS